MAKINSSLLALVAASLFAHSAHGMEQAPCSMETALVRHACSVNQAAQALQETIRNWQAPINYLREEQRAAREGTNGTATNSSPVDADVVKLARVLQQNRGGTYLQVMGLIVADTKVFEENINQLITEIRRQQEILHEAAGLVQFCGDQARAAQAQNTSALSNALTILEHPAQQEGLLTDANDQPAEEK